MSSRPALAPGVAVYRRSHDRAQIGLNPGLVLTAVPGLDEALRLIDGLTPRADLERAIGRITGTDASVLLDALQSAGLLTDVPARADTARPAIGLQTLGPVGDFAGLLGTALRESDLVVTGDESPDHVLLISDGEPARGALERLRVEQIPHTAVSLLEGHLRWGPTIGDLTDPCWGCVDAHFADRDPAWPALTTQFGRLTAVPAHTSLTPAQTHIALGHLLRDLAVPLAAGRRPPAGRLTLVRPDLSLSRIDTPHHPDCGCHLLPVSPPRLSLTRE